MSKAANLLEAMKRNPRDWRIDDVKTVAKLAGLKWRQPSGSHATFYSENGELRLTIPSHKPIDPVYITRFVRMLDGSRKED